MSETWALYLLAAVVAGLAGLCLWLWRARRRDLDRLRSLGAEVLDAAKDTDFAERVKRRAPAELADLSGSINRLFDALHAKEQALQRRENLFQDLANTMPEVLLVHRERVIFANAAATTLLSLTPEELVGRLTVDLLPPELPRRVEAGLAAIVLLVVFGFGAGVLVFGGLRLVWLSFELGPTTAALGLPLGAVYLALPFAGLAICLYTAEELARRWRRPPRGAVP